MNFDITPLLDDWEYRPGQIKVRKFTGKDGAEKIQLRVDLGLLQLNAHGRPDGKRPFGHESLLDHFQERIQKHIEENDGDDEGFRLSAEDCLKLQQEAIQYHHRYICLFQLQDFEGVIRDAERNLQAFDFVETYAESEELAATLQQLRPQLLLMHTRARGSLAVQSHDHSRALAAIQSGIDSIREFYESRGRIDLIESSPEIQSLEAWAVEIRTSRPLTEREKLQQALDEAVRREDYEAAARVRDSIRRLERAE